MKTRTSFVANSSSSSFIIQKSTLTLEQIEKIKNYYAIATELDNQIQIWIEKYKGPDAIARDATPWYGYLCDSWVITETDTEIKGECIIDNFDFSAYLEFIGVDTDNVNYTSD